MTDSNSEKTLKSAPTDLATIEGSKNNRDKINDQIIVTFSIWGGFLVILVVWLWYIRVRAYQDLFDDVPEGYSLWQAFFRLFYQEGGGASIAVMVLAIGWLAWYWWGFRKYLLLVSPYIADAHRPVVGDDKRKMLFALHDPPGDLFTLVGIAFTFLGLALAMALISADVIQAVAVGDEDVVQSLAAAAIVFGSSLAIGLGASLLGVILAVQARKYAARWCPDIHAAWDTSKALSKLNNLDDVQEKISKLHAHMTSPQNNARAGDPAGEANAAAMGAALGTLQQQLALLEESLKASTQQAAATAQAIGGMGSTIADSLSEKLNEAFRVQLSTAVSRLVLELPRAMREEGPPPPPNPEPAPDPDPQGDGGPDGPQRPDGGGGGGGARATGRPPGTRRVAKG